MNSPMCDTSNSPHLSRTALCSAVMPCGYCTGISQPAKGTILAPSATCFSWNGVRLSAACVVAVVMFRNMGGAKAGGRGRNRRGRAPRRGRDRRVTSSRQPRNAAEIAAGEVHAPFIIGACMRSTLAIIMGSVIVGTACADGADSPRVTAPSSRSSQVLGTGAFQFTPLDASAVCTVSGGDPNAPFLIPTGYTQSIVASEPAFADAPDMNTVNETGPQAGRFLYRPSEGSVGQVTVTDLVTGQTKLIAARSDWEGMDPIVWTPWGTLLVGEETNAQQRPDPDFPSAVGGLMYEIFLHQGDPTVADSVVARPALGAKAHEGTRFDSQGNVYGI